MDLFVYGTLMVSRVMHAVSGHAGDGRPASLVGFRRRRLRNEVYPGIVPRPGERVDGMLYRHLTRDQLAALDVFEGEMYRRIGVVVTVDGARRPADAYVIGPAFEHLLGDEDWSLDDFLARGLGGFLAGYPGFAALPHRERPDERD